MLSDSEYIWKENIVDNDQEDTMEFDTWKKYVFRADLSNGLTGDEVVTILHPGNRQLLITTHRINCAQILM